MRGKRLCGILLAGAVGVTGLCRADEDSDPVSYVLPLMGTDSSHKLSSGNVYPAGMKLNGKNYTKNFIAADMLKKGASIDLTMAAEPNLQRGIEQTDAPYSFSRP